MKFVQAKTQVNKIKGFILEARMHVRMRCRSLQEKSFAFMFGVIKIMFNKNKVIWRK
jgi:hypothetical protein